MRLRRRLYGRRKGAEPRLDRGGVLGAGEDHEHPSARHR